MKPIRGVSSPSPPAPLPPPIQIHRTVVVAGTLITAGGIALIPIRLLGGSGGPESPFASVAFALPFVVAGLLPIWCERHNQPLILFALGVAVGPLSLVSIVMFPLVLPAAVIFAAGAQRLTRPRWTEFRAAALTTIGLIASFMVLLIHQDPRSWSDENQGGSTGDIITWAETGISVAILVTVVSIVVLPRSITSWRQGAPTLGVG